MRNSHKDAAIARRRCFQMFGFHDFVPGEGVKPKRKVHFYISINHLRALLEGIKNSVLNDTELYMKISLLFTYSLVMQ